MLVLAVVALALVAIIASTLTRKLVRRVTRLANGIRQLDEGPLEQLRDGLQALAGGDLTVALRPDQETIPTRRRRDQIGDLIRSFNAMGAKTAGTEAYETARGKVSEMLREIGETSHTLSATSEQMADVSMSRRAARSTRSPAPSIGRGGRRAPVRAISAAQAAHRGGRPRLGELGLRRGGNRRGGRPGSRAGAGGQPGGGRGDPGHAGGPGERCGADRGDPLPGLAQRPDRPRSSTRSARSPARPTS